MAVFLIIILFMVVGFAAMEGIKKQKERAEWMYGHDFRLSAEQKNRWTRIIGVGLAKEVGDKHGKDIFWVKYNKQSGMFQDFNNEKKYFPYEIKIKRK